MFSPTRRRIAALPIALLTLAPSLISPSAADAQTPKCGGRTATHVGTGGNDVIYGTNGADVIFAGAGNDKVYGFSGDDLICGGSGADTIEGGFGQDRILGGNGNDRLRGGYGYDRIWGGNGNDWMVGDDGFDQMWGGNGDDDLYGGNGGDNLYGGDGNDRIAGQYGYDVVSGDLGDDLVVGENPRPDADNGWTKRVVADVFRAVAPFCSSGCIAGSAGERSIQPVPGPPGVLYNRVQYSFDSEGFVLEMRLRDTRHGFSQMQFTEISASGWLDGFGSPRRNYWSAYRSTDFRGAYFSALDGARHIQWILRRTY